MTPTASAQGVEGLSLEWEAPGGCPDHAAVVGQVRNRLGPGHGAGRQVAAHGEVRAAAGGGYRLALRLQGEGLDTTRRLDDASCAQLADAAALLLALALDPSLIGAESSDVEGPHEGGTQDGGGEGEPSDGSPSERELAQEHGREAEGVGEPRDRPQARSEASSEQVPDRADAPGPPLRWGLGVGVGGLLGSGMLPQLPAIGLRPRLTLEIDAVRVLASGAFYLRGDRSLDGHPGSRVEASALVAGVGLCHALGLPRPPWELAPCLLGELGQVDVQTHGVTVPAGGHVRWLAGGLGLLSSYALAGGLGLFLDASVVAPATPPRLLLESQDGLQEVHRAGPVAASLSLGIVYVLR